MKVKVLKEAGYEEILHFPHYFINKSGDVIRKDGFKPKTRLSKDGYVKIHLFDFEKRKYIDQLIHRLVLSTFLYDCPADKELNHIDGNKRNNGLENLEYTSHLENMQHAFNNGLVKPIDARGELNIKAKLTKKDVNEIRSLYSKGNITQKQLGNMFGVDQTQISCIILNKTWNNI